VTGSYPQLPGWPLAAQQSDFGDFPQVCGLPSLRIAKKAPKRLVAASGGPGEVEVKEGLFPGAGPSRCLSCSEEPNAYRRLTVKGCKRRCNAISQPILRDEQSRGQRRAPRVAGGLGRCAGWPGRAEQVMARDVNLLVVLLLVLAESNPGSGL
jgi:hypothetical protein